MKGVLQAFKDFYAFYTTLFKYHDLQHAENLEFTQGHNYNSSIVIFVTLHTWVTLSWDFPAICVR